MPTTGMTSLPSRTLGLTSTVTLLSRWKYPPTGARRLRSSALAKSARTTLLLSLCRPRLSIAPSTSSLSGVTTRQTPRSMLSLTSLLPTTSTMLANVSRFIVTATAMHEELTQRSRTMICLLSDCRSMGGRSNSAFILEWNRHSMRSALQCYEMPLHAYIYAEHSCRRGLARPLCQRQEL